MFSSNVDPVLAGQLSERAGIEKIENIGRYLGVPSIQGRTKKETYAYLLDKVNQKLEGWKMKHLSFAGRQIMVQAVLSVIPFYTMQSTVIPAGILSQIEQRIRAFLWGGSENKKGCNLVNWETVTKSKGEGGLGIRRLKEMNEAFMAKIGWRLEKEKDNLWASVESQISEEGSRQL